mgnify:CR=1 FL=1
MVPTMTRPAGIPTSYVETSPGVWCHPSRVRRVEACQPEPDRGPALEREAPAPESGGSGVGARVIERRVGTVRPSEAVVLVVTLIAMLRREFDAHDNLRAALKPLVDAIAASLGVPDNDRRVRWQYAQARTAGAARVVVMVEKKI